MSNPLRSKKRGNTIVWILMGMLILGLGGFGARNFGGSTRAIGAVGDREIDIRDYARSLNREIAAISAQIQQPVSFAQAQALGIDRSVMARVLASAALDNEADKIGLSVGDAEVRKRILAMDAFKGLDGAFDRDAYKLTLRQEGLSETEFEAKLRDDAARTLLQGAILGGTVAPDTLVDHIAAYLTETRTFTLSELIPSDLPEPVRTPEEQEIKAYYDANNAAFTKPETRRITYIWLSPDMLADDVELDEEALKAAYQERIDEFVTPERRLVERLIYPSEDDARAAKARFDAGEATLEDLAAERGLSLADIDLGEVTEADLGSAGAEIFALEQPGLVGPLLSELGPALFAMNGILEAQETTFEEARDDLSAEAAVDKARRLVADKSDGIEDLLASGATLEEVAADTGMELAEVEFTAEAEEGIAAYTAFREAASAATANDFPTLAALDDGGVFALRLDGIDPPALRPLEEVRDAAIEGWQRQETSAQLTKLAEDVLAQLEGGATLESTGRVTTRYENFARGGFIDGAPAAVADRVFRLEPGSATVIDAEGKVFVAALGDVHVAETTGEDYVRASASLDAQFGQALSQDMFELFTKAIEAEAGIHIDQAAVNAVHSQMN